MSLRAETMTTAERLRTARVLDGGFATELEYQGAKIDGPLWSAHVLEEAPEKIVAVHRAYIEAGAEIVATASYQVSRQGYEEYGLTAGQADGALRRAVELARQAAEEFPERRVLVAASLGPYGAMLHSGAEYHGNYDCTFEDLVRFHRERVEVLAAATGPARPDLLAFETLPSLEEARAVGAALEGFPELTAWMSFTCRDEAHVAHGERLAECAGYAAGLAAVAGVGVNCTRPEWVTALVSAMRAVTTKPILVYPNSGEGWDAEGRCWTGASDPRAFGALAVEWRGAGAQIVGGCCRTRPAHIREVAEALG